MSNVSLVSANLATVCIESFCYGIFFVLSVSSIYLLVRRYEHISKVSRYSSKSVLTTPMFIGAVSMFIVISGHWMVTVTRLFEAFVNFDGGMEPGAFYGELSQVTEIVKTAFLVAALLIGDTMVIYRLWKVWDHSTVVVIFPICTLLGLTACGVGVTYQFTRLRPGEDVFVSQAGRWITSDGVFTLCTNVYSSALIAWRVWRSHLAVRKYGGGTLMGVLATLVESAALYTSWNVFFLASYLSHSNLQFTSIDVFPIMSGISFMLINTRVGLGWAQMANQLSSEPGSVASAARSRAEQMYAMRPLAVNIVRVVDQDDESALSQKHPDEPCRELTSAACPSSRPTVTVKSHLTGHM